MVAGATADPVKDYLKQIGKVPLLNAEMEVELAKRIEAGLFSDEKLARVGIQFDRDEPCLHAPGCAHCRHTGYAGRQAVYEMFEVTEPVRSLIASPSFNADELRHYLRENGVMDIVENSLQLVADGTTTCAEIIRVFGSGGS